MNWKILAILFVSSTVALTQADKSGVELKAPTTFPIVFSNTVSAARSHAGDPVEAKTSQAVHLRSGAVIPAGTKISGHVVSANAFVYDDMPYVRQKQSTLTIQFDSLEFRGESLPLKVTVRAMADPITSEEARMPQANDVGSQGTVTQIGGDQLTPSQSNVHSSYGDDVVAYNKRDGVYAHLIANGDCNASSVEVSVGVFSGSACGLYGFNHVSALETGSAAKPSMLTLVSTHTSPKIWKNSTALLEVLPSQQKVASR